MASNCANRADLSEHRRKHRHRRDHQDYDRRLSEARGLSDKREVVNKIASIDIWATERLYKKWQREALAARRRSTHSPDQDPTMFNYSATQQSAYKRHRDREGGKYFVASMAQQINNKRIRTATKVDLDGGRGGDALQPHLHRCQNRRRAQSRPDESRQWQQHFKQSVQPKHKHHELPHSRRHLSLSNAAEPHAHCECAKIQQQKAECHSERTSEIDWPDSWPSIWGSNVPQCAQRVSSNSDHQVAVEGSADSRRQERSKDKRLRRRQQSGSRGDAGQHAIAGKDTVEALLTLNPSETADANNAKLQLVGREENRGNSHILAMRGVTHTLQINQATPVHKEDQTKSQSVGFNAYNAVQNGPIILEGKQQPQFNMVGFEDLCKTDALENEFNVARLVRSEKCRQEQAKKLPKPVVWLIANDPPALEQRFGSDEDGVNFNNEVRLRETADDRQAFNAPFGSTDAMAERGIPTSDAISHYQQQVALHSFAATTIACHNSTDCKSLKMLSSATTEREEEEEIQSHIGGPMRAAQISYIKSTTYYRITASLEPEVRMHSNTTSYKSINSDTESEDGDGIIHTVQEFGEPKSMEPKTGTVTRKVQVEVLRAAQLMAAKGFAGLIGARPSELDSDTQTTTDTLDSTKYGDDDYDMGEDFKTEGDRDSLGELDDLEDDDNEEFDEYPIYSKGKSSADTASLSSSSSSDERGRGNGSRRSSSRRRRKSSSAQSKGDDERLSRYSSQKRPVAAAAAPSEKMMLPMTQCPTTRHRIECFTTRSGQVKCYMTARHPVKCRVEGGRIVCKATVNAESSNLPYPCNAAWQ